MRRNGKTADFGLDKEGCFHFGSCGVTVRVESPSSIMLTEDISGDILSELPESAGAEDIEQLYQLRNNIPGVISAHRKRLAELFATGKTLSAARWRGLYLEKRSVLRFAARNVIWAQGDGTFITAENGLLDRFGNSYALTGEPVKIAYPMEMTPDTIGAWEAYLCWNAIVQPIEQMSEPTVDLSVVSEDRYCGINFHNEELKMLGAHAVAGNTRSLIADESLYLKRDKYYNMVYTDQYITRISSVRPLKQTRLCNHILAVLDLLSLEYKIRTDDVSIFGTIRQNITREKVDELIAAASENGARKWLAALLDLKNSMGGDYCSGLSLDED